MTSETDHPRQRTVAELLAEHGGAAPSGRRRRRRADDGPDDEELAAGPQAPPVLPAPPTPQSPPPPIDRAPNGYGRFAPDDQAPAGPDRRILREPVPPGRGPEPPPPARNGGPQGFGGRPPAPEGQTDQMPRLRGGQRPPLPPAPLGFDAPPQRPGRQPQDGGDDGPPTMLGVAPQGAEAWHRSRTEHRRPDVDGGGPPTQAGRPFDLDADFDDRPAQDDRDVHERYADYDDDYEGDYDADDDYDEDEDEDRGYRRDYDAEDDDEFDEDERTDRRSRRRAESDEAGSGSGSWPAVVAQWIIGAVGGAALWVGFRFLWRDLTVVAIAAAVLVTVGLVLVVRHLLRTTDTRTTVFAVLVGLLLTVSPVILLLLGR